MNDLIKKGSRNTGYVILLAASGFICHTSYATTVRCAPDSNTSNNVFAFDFNKLPNQIPNKVPIGATIYDVTMNLDLWCAKELNTGTIIAGPEKAKIYINRGNTTNALGNKSGLTFFVTINGERDAVSKSYDSGYSTDKVFVPGISTSNYTKISVPVRVELVKTGESMAISPFRNDVSLFSIGDAGYGYIHYWATNVRKLSFSEYTCNTTTPNIYQTLPGLNVAELPQSGRADNHVTDFSVSLQCNGNIWSTLSINMAFSGTPVAGLERNGVYPFFNRAGSMAEGIGFQILHQDSTGAFVESENNAWFKIGSFSSSSHVLTVPLRAAYYRTKEKVTPGELTGTVTYTINYM
ncbi:fimbrial protein [Pantoea sp. FN0305]|uniref:fimbrial protein n=1 Tax=Pantoea sp. FN0305 TaxID=3418559 RepID=UPI003CE6E1C0